MILATSAADGVVHALPVLLGLPERPDDDLGATHAVTQTFSFPCLSERISLFKLFEIGFLVVFGDLEGLFCAENENFPV